MSRCDFDYDLILQAFDPFFKKQVDIRVEFVINLSRYGFDLICSEAHLITYPKPIPNTSSNTVLMGYEDC